MVKNYFQTAWRIISRNKIYSVINIVGLTIGLCACMLVATVVIDDLSYDKQWQHKNDLYRIVSVNKMGEGLYERFASSFAGLTNKLRTDYPEVKAAGILNVYNERLKPDTNNPNGVNISVLGADTSVWQMLDLNVLEGNPRRYVEGTKNIIITKTFSNRFFPKGNAVGKIIYDVPTFSAKPASYLITGVIEDIPSNSVFRSQAIVLHKRRNEQLTKEAYGTYSPNNFILLEPGTDIAKFSAKINNWYAGFVTGKTHYQYEFQPLTDVYLKSDFAQNQLVKGDFRNIYIFAGVALLLLIIACVNFVNLSTARAVHRLRETGVRKILGASRRQVILQFLSESVLFFLIATILATFIYYLSLQLVEKYIGYPLTQVFISRYQLFVFVYSAIGLISLLTGFYPAWVISGFKPAATLKGNLFSGTGMGGQHFVRKCLVVLQFSISIVVLVALIVVQQQVSYLKHKDIGFNKNNLLNIGFIAWGTNGQSFKNELLKQQGVESVSITPWTPASAGYMTREVDDPNHIGNKLKIWYISGDPDLAKTLGLRLEKGRFLNKSLSTDAMNGDSLMTLPPEQYRAVASTQSSLITAYTAKLLQVKGLNTTIPGALTSPVGIVSDFNSESLRKSMEPTILIADKEIKYGGMLVRIQTGQEKQVTAYINALWRRFYPEKLLDIQWVDDMFARQYDKESRLRQLFAFFSGLSMFLAALGIFGLIVQVTSLRTKEIGIRKVLGASVRSIVSLFSIDFLKLVMIAIVISSPIAWWLMSQWLKDFAYRITINWQVFFLAGMTALVTALITISFQAIKAATANPVKSLRTE